MEEKVIDPGFPQNAPAADYSRVIAIISQWRAILNTRLLALLALVGSLTMFGFVMYDPTPLRLWGASLFTVGAVWPLIILHFRKG